VYVATAIGATNAFVICKQLVPVFIRNVTAAVHSIRKI
jgi:hypothetical protein